MTELAVAVEAALAAHEEHRRSTVSMSWGERAECNTCDRTVVVWNDSGSPIWIEGVDTLVDLHYLLRDRDYPEKRR